jgi:amino acid permease
MISYIEGILKIANLFLALVAGGVALSMFTHAWKNRELRAWRPMIIALVLFGVQQILGALRAFGVYESAYLTHINVSLLLAFLIYALVLQIGVVKGYK